MPRVLVGFVLLLFATLPDITCFQWTNTLPDESVKYTCANGNVLLPWSYTTSSGDVIESIQWFFHGGSEEVVAIFSGGSFAPTASFSGRVTRVEPAGIALSHVTSGDRGNYSVEVSGHDASGISFTSRRTVVVVTEENNNLMTSDGDLHAVLESQAIFSNTTGQWSLVVSCGHFNFAGNPPFDMEWRTPSGAVVPSDGYKDGYFQLHVTSGGDYTCTIRQPAADVGHCNGTSQNATVHVDKMEARVTLMEARQGQLEKENEELRHEVTQLKERDRVDNTSSLAQSLLNLTDKVKQRVAFTAWLIAPHSGHSLTVTFKHVVSNYGNGYSPSTGVFTAPVAGLYFFRVTSAPSSSDAYPDATLRQEGAAICVAGSARAVYGEEASCGAAVHVALGQRVWVGSGNLLAGSYTSFTGFLINAD